jgi:hypothetical protein
LANLGDDSLARSILGNRNRHSKRLGVFRGRHSGSRYPFLSFELIKSPEAVESASAFATVPSL